MREAIGGSYLFYLVIIFLLIYIFFMSFVMNYASAYRAANYVVTQIETCQAYNNKDCQGKDLTSITTEIGKKYYYKVPKGSTVSVCCIDNGSNSSVYRVDLPVEFTLPFIGNFSPVHVKAETKTIQNISCKKSGFSICK